MRLWNAHKRVIHKLKQQSPKLERLQAKGDGWRKLLSEDVVKFVDDLESYNLAGSSEEQKERIGTILHDPARFFSRPKNVPLELRKQIYLYCSLASLTFHTSRRC